MSAAIISVEHVSFSYPAASSDRSPIQALKDISFTIKSGEFIGLIGQNGSGKTTLARHLNGLLKPASGRVLVDGSDTREVAIGALASNVGYVFQNPDHALFLPTIREEIQYGPERFGLSADECRIRVDEALDRFGLAEYADRHTAAFGKGLRRLTVIAAIYATAPDVIVLDEPTGGLDRKMTGRLLSILHDLANEGRAIVLISHDMSLIAEHCQRVVLLDAGRYLADGSPEELFNDFEILEEAGIQPPQITRLARDLDQRALRNKIVTVDQFMDAYDRLRDIER